MFSEELGNCETDPRAPASDDGARKERSDGEMLKDVMFEKQMGPQNSSCQSLSPKLLHFPSNRNRRTKITLQASLCPRASEAPEAKENAGLRACHHFNHWSKPCP